MESDKSSPVKSKIGIIGAGISGIAAVKELAKHNPIVFEATGSIGGVWKHCTFASTRLQTPRCDFEFSDYPWSNRDDPSFPTHLEVLDYLHGYVARFDLLKYVMFDSKVVELRYVGDREAGRIPPEEKISGEHGSMMKGHPVWEVAVEHGRDDSLKRIQWYAFEVVVVCVGKYGDFPRIPQAFPQNKGPEVFRGTVMHSMHYSKLNQDDAEMLLRGKKVVVVGYKKTAIDLAMECAKANQGQDGQPCTLVVRTVHWTVPSYKVWGLPFYMFYSTRFSQFLHERPEQGLLGSFLRHLLSPLRGGISKFVESYLLWKLPLEKYGLKPDHPFEEDYASCQMAILPEDFFSEADKGNIQFKRVTSKWCFWEGGLEFMDGTRIEADVVIFATGYEGKRKLDFIMPEPFRSLVVGSNSVMPLYRGTVHPLIPNMAFLGYVESVSNLHTSEMRSKWLASLLDDGFELPSREEMVRAVNEETEVMKRTTRYYKKKPCISTFSINHTDDICRDIGINPWRKKGWLQEAFSPYSSHDYS
ncbi:hypothetical protein MLD38_014221 [Melastoma candidum]|uniref:Uncharacterized protein n=1 Tax=Melastoma candidum TaxID=119954 RepID=A0ACB9RKH9_9MYRT|nr:hypothetical protein MLD38_014221 [Melastoma candidum]